MPISHVRRRLSAGVELHGDGSAHARVWAPACRSVEAIVEPANGVRRTIALDREEGGYFSAVLSNLAAGDRYWYRLDSDRLRPDPVSRFQPDGPHGPSAIVDPAAFRWSDRDWKGLGADGQVIYELHVGTFTPAGTWAAAAEELEELARIGVTVVEMMPVADFPGRFGWGYDGVNLYAPTRLYGHPDDLRAFVDRAHALGLGVILDVVYNHLGPDGNYLGDFSPDYFTDRYETDWGQALNFEGPPQAREFFVENAGYWVDEFHFDGLRLDATQDIHDASTEHVIGAIVRRAREAAPHRSVYIVAENEPQHTRLVRPAKDGGYGLNALWNDDYHHSAMVALTGHREAYYADYGGTPQELVSCAKHGWLYQGQWYTWQKKHRGTPALDLPGCAFVAYLENHDQVANSAFGRRLHQLASPAKLRALTALTLLGPATPLLFQGQEFAASAPFRYFADHRPELHESIRQGRREFLGQFVSTHDPDVVKALPSPIDESTFRLCKLDLTERVRHADWYALHCDLLAIRRNDPVLARAGRRRVEGAVLGTDAFVIRYIDSPLPSQHGRAAGDRLLVINLGPELDVAPLPEPLLAPPDGAGWTVMWSSEAVRYGGQGIPPLTPEAIWHIPAQAAVLVRSEPAS